MNRSHTRHRLAAALASTVLLLAACGGGGGGDDTVAPPVTPPSARFGASSNYANVCTLEGEKRFLRAYMDEVYLWYNEIPEVDAAQYNSIADYFDALLVKTPDGSGEPRDRFSAALPESEVRSALRQSSVPVAADLRTALSATFAVPVSKVVASPGGRRVGYIQFNDHATGAQDELISDFRQLREAGIQDIVLDLRFNSGGFLYVAQSTASMITGPGNNGRLFEQLQYNDKRSAETAASSLDFIGTVQFPETLYPAGTELPQLNLTRAYVLASAATCSASESIINSLRGVDVEVIQVGSTTCGKPYGFHQKNNCGTAFFPIEFKGSNAKGFGDYTSGFSATCAVTDNPEVYAGSSSDPLLNAALYHADHGSCPALARALGAAVPTVAAPRAGPTRPAWAGRLLTGDLR